jgi:transmembrane sensor
MQQQQPLHDWLLDHGFKQWALEGQNDAFWQEWLTGHPEHRDEAETLRQLVVAMHRTGMQLAPDTENHLWAQVRQQTGRELGGAITRRLWVRYAAAAIVGLLALVGLWQFRSTEANFQTAFGETRILTLPDGSTVTLNSNSSVRYAAQWPVGRTREIWLKGEAFFEVNERGTVRKDKFIVHTADAHVEVLGTKFNVNSHREVTKVALQSGSVKLSSNDRPETVMLTPGDLALYDPKAKTFKVERANVTAQSSWKERKLLFNNTSLREIGLIIEDTYGLKVTIADEQLAQRRVNGEIPIRDKAILFQALEQLYNLNITQTDKNNLTIAETNE